MTMSAEFRGPAFKCFGLAVFVFSSVVAQGETENHSDLRRVIRDSFQYDPAVRAKSQEQPIPELAAYVEGEPEIIVLPKFEVKSRPLPRGLVEAVAASRPLEPQNQSKLGTGVHEKDFGKVRAYAVTVLYVPIMFGLRW